MLAYISGFQKPANENDTADKRMPTDMEGAIKRVEQIFNTYTEAYDSMGADADPHVKAELWRDIIATGTVLLAANMWLEGKV